MPRVSPRLQRLQPRSSRMGTSHQAGAPFTGETTSRPGKRIKLAPSTENSSTLLDPHKLKKLQASGALTESNLTVLSKESLVIAGSSQLPPQSLSRKRESKRSSPRKNTAQMVSSCSTCSTWENQYRLSLTITYQSRRKEKKSNKKHRSITPSWLLTRQQA